MRALKTTFYDTPSGVEFTVSWDDEAEFLAAREFLRNLTGGLLDTSMKVDFCCLLTAEQREAMYDYRDELRRAKQRQNPS
jgi:hypothetical protein